MRRSTNQRRVYSPQPKDSQNSWDYKREQEQEDERKRNRSRSPSRHDNDSYEQEREDSSSLISRSSDSYDNPHNRRSRESKQEQKNERSRRRSPSPRYDDPYESVQEQQDNGNQSHSGRTKRAKTEALDQQAYQTKYQRDLNHNEIVSYFKKPVDELLKRIAQLPTPSQQLDKLQYTLIILVKLAKQKQLPSTAEEFISNCVLEFCIILQTWFNTDEKQREPIPDLAKYISVLLQKTNMLLTQLSRTEKTKSRKTPPSIKTKISCKKVDFLLWIHLEFKMDFLAIANTLKIVGCLASNRHLEGMLDPILIEKLFDKLLQSCPSPKTIAEMVRAVGCLAMAKYLSGYLDPTKIDSILGKLLESCQASESWNSEQSSLISEDIVRVLQEVGVLSSTDYLNGKLDTTVIELLIGKLVEIYEISESWHPEKFKLIPGNIARVVKELGVIASSNHLKQKLNAAPINALLGIFLQSNPTLENIIQVLNELGILASTEQLNGFIEPSIIHSLIAKLVEFNPTSEQIVLAWTAVGCLASKDHLEEKKLDVEIIGSLFHKLLTSTAPEHITKSLDELVCIAANNCLNKRFNVSVIDLLLCRLVKSHPIIGNISEALNSVGLLAAEKDLTGYFDIITIDLLFDKLLKLNPTAEQITQAWKEVGCLASMNHLRGKLNATLVNSLLRKLVESHPTAEQIIQVLLELYCLARKNHLRNRQLDATLINLLLDTLEKFKPTEEDLTKAKMAASYLASKNYLHGKLDARFNYSLLQESSASLSSSSASSSSHSNLSLQQSGSNRSRFFGSSSPISESKVSISDFFSTPDSKIQQEPTVDSDESKSEIKMMSNPVDELINFVKQLITRKQTDSLPFYSSAPASSIPLFSAPALSSSHSSPPRQQQPSSSSGSSQTAAPVSEPKTSYTPPCNPYSSNPFPGS